MPLRRRCLRVLHALVLVAACACLPSCMTYMVWGFEYKTDAQGESSWEWSEEAWGSDDLAWWHRLLLTPLTLTVDCLTAPVQCWMYCGDAEDDCDHRRRDR